MTVTGRDPVMQLEAIDHVLKQFKLSDVVMTELKDQQTMKVLGIWLRGLPAPIVTLDQDAIKHFFPSA